MTSPITLYRFALSGHSHRVQLLLSLLDLPFVSVDVNVLKGEGQEPAFLAKNPLGQVPVIEDGEVTLADSNAIMVYLALRYDAPRRWYPSEPVAAARVQRFLSLAAGELNSGPGALRLATLLGRSVERSPLEARTAALFALLESTLQGQPYLIGADPTIADVAMYTYTAHAPEGGVSLEPYPAVRTWLTRVEALSHFVPMQRAAAR